MSGINKADGFEGGGNETKKLTMDDDAKAKFVEAEVHVISQPALDKPKGDEGIKQRQEWSHEIEFVLAAIGNAVGLGNIWRFPYLAYESGGGAFLIPYFIMLFMCGIPLLYMELAVGQFTRRGPVGALQKLCPFFQGAGMATVMLSFFLATYYNVIMTWTIYYLFSSFQAVLPWADCSHDWNTKDCWDNYTDAALPSKPNNSVSPSQEFYENKVLEQSSGIDEQGTVKWDLALILLLSWIIVYLCIWKGVRLTGKVVYFTATFPYLIITILLIRGVTLEGSLDGIKYFIEPDWDLLTDPKVWVNAAAQNFNSIGIAFGSMITFSSYNKRSNKILRDVLSITILNSLTSILAGFAIFSIMGYIAHNQDTTVDKVATDGPGLLFIVYPEALVTMPVSQLFSVLFFFMLLCLAIDSQFASVEVILSTLEDHFGKQIYKIFQRKELLVLFVCVLAYLLGLPNITNGGIYFFKIIDFYSSAISLMLVAMFEVMAVSWFYGGRRLAKNVKEMTGTTPFVAFVACWVFISPLLIATIMIFNWVDYTPVTYGDYVFPGWAEGLGWVIASASLVCIPLGMIKAIKEAKGHNLAKKLYNAFQTTVDTDPECYPVIHELGYVTSLTPLKSDTQL